MSKLDEAAKEYVGVKDPHDRTWENSCEYVAFKAGFMKAIELAEKNKFGADDMEDIVFVDDLKDFAGGI